MSNHPAAVLCPECKLGMVIRKGKYGIFWGCQDYPNCRGTRDNMGRSKADRAKEKGEDYEHDDKDETNRFSFKRTR